MAILSVKALSKNYGYIKALNEISFDVPKGAVFGLLGPNGSGKTTLLGIVTDVLKSTKGTFTLFDEAPTNEHRKKIGTLLETPNFYHYLSAEKNLMIAAQIKGRGTEDIESVLKQVNLYDRKDTPFSSYSLGMKQRLAIASSLLGNPDVLILDEPTNGLDPVGIAEIRELIAALAQKGKTIIMASHMLDEVEKVCTHVLILKKGKSIASGPVGEILQQDDVVEVSSSNMDILYEAMKSYPSIKNISRQNDYLHAAFAAGSVAIEDINRFCFEKGIVLSHMMMKRISLEKRFLELTNDKS